MKNLKMRHKLLIAFLALSLIPVLIGGGVVYFRMHGKLMDQAFESLKSVAERKYDKIESFIEVAKKEMELISSGRAVAQALEQLLIIHEKSGAAVESPYDVSRTDYIALARNLDAHFRNVMRITGFKDLFLICAPHGHVMYTVAKEADLGTNLGAGPLNESNLAQLWRKVTETGRPYTTDFKFYPPSDGMAAFIGAPVFDASGKVYAVIAFQFDESKINAIMQRSTGLGKTGESYLVGSDYLMRTQSRLTKENTILKRDVRSFGVEQALAGKTGQSAYRDYRGEKVLGYFSPLAGTPWAMITEIDLDEVEEPVYELRNTIILVCILSIVAVLIVSVFIARAIERPIRKLMEAAKVVAGGDLRATIEADSDDEIGQLASSFNTMVKGLLSMTREVRNVSEGVSSASEELSSSAEELNATSEEMSQAIQQIAKGAESTSQQLTDSSRAVGEMTQLAGEVLTTTRNAAQSATLAVGTARDGAQAAKEAKERIGHVFDVVRESSDSVKTFEKRSGQINEIVETITGFADQTNLLALNAAIEAARAGEAGRGFAVVAEEVRKLAENSGRAAKEIGDLIHSIQEEVGSAVASMDRGFGEVQAGKDVIVKAGTALEGLAGTVEQNAAMFT
ncbi:MAG TPA: methyl-accepting chemotaxis protein, partial [bacterium]|nr:methyl-accepting chemotaxis protein [bacterium]